MKNTSSYTFYHCKVFVLSLSHQRIFMLLPRRQFSKQLQNRQNLEHDGHGVRAQQVTAVRVVRRRVTGVGLHPHFKQKRHQSRGEALDSLRRVETFACFTWMIWIWSIKTTIMWYQRLLSYHWWKYSSKTFRQKSHRKADEEAFHISGRK